MDLSELTQTLQDLQNQGLYNNIRTIQSQQGPYLTINNKQYLNLSSNNYLGLASDERLKQAAKRAIDAYGVGTASVRALLGTHELHIQLEQKLAHFKHAEAALVLTGGYLANMAAIQTILDKDDIVISDELNHASIIDAVKLAGVGNKYIYRHVDMGDLEAQLNAAGEVAAQPRADDRKRRILIVTDGVFSMDGDIAPLPEIVTRAKNHGALTMVDDAHGEGVLGSHGRGIVDHFNLHGQVDIEVGTLSKAFGVMGGFITAKKELIDWYRQKARQFLFTNALSIPDTAALIAAVEIMDGSDAEVKKLWENTHYLVDALHKIGCDTGRSQTPIVPVMIGDENQAKDLALKLFEEGIIATAIKFPMVAKGTARLRLQPSALHSKDDLAKVVEVLSKTGFFKANSH